MSINAVAVLNFLPSSKVPKEQSIYSALAHSALPYKF
jgi:hypothetical protein